jgi:2-keto-3-deoxy-L-rhamnonate aldolase RhmA
MTRNFRASGEHVSLGTFIKTASANIVEVLALTSLDFGVLDAEHSPLDRQALDTLLLAGRATNLPLLVRPAEKSVQAFQTVLDSGASGLLVPHVDTVDQARRVAAMARYRNGERGFSSSTRAAGFGTVPMAQAIAQGDRTLLICQIETPDAVSCAEAIAAVEGIDGLLVGRADLAVAMGESASASPAVMSAALEVTRIARKLGKIAGMAVGAASECQDFRKAGANWFIIGSDQGLLKQAAQQMAFAVNPEGAPA